MAQGLTGDLVMIAVVIGVFCFWMVRRDLPFLLAVLVALVKVAVPLIYFAWFYDASWNFLDDLSYQQVGQDLLAHGYNPFTILFIPEGLTRLIFLANGSHILYLWWNHLAEFLFGTHYYAPVFLNVGLTCVAGRFLYRIAQLARFPQNYCQALLLFFLFHWDILAWSSLINQKDILVLTLAIAALYYLICAAVIPAKGRERWRQVGWLAMNLFALFWIRFYVPLLIGMAFAVWLLLTQSGRRKVILFIAAASVVLLALPGQIERTNSVTIATSPPTLAYNLFRFAMTPQPWSLEPSYTFLLLPATLHWLFVLPALIAGRYLWRHSPVMVLVLIFFVLATLVYSVSDYLVTPRERVQLTFIWAWLQFHVIFLATRLLARLRASQPEFPALLAPPVSR